MRIYLLYRKQWERELYSGKANARALHSSEQSAAREEQSAASSLPFNASVEEQIAALITDCKVPTPIPNTQLALSCQRGPSNAPQLARTTGNKEPPAKRRRADLSGAREGAGGDSAPLASELLTSGAAIDMMQSSGTQRSREAAARIGTAGERELPRAICFKLVPEQPKRAPTRSGAGARARRAGDSARDGALRAAAASESAAHVADCSARAGVAEQTPAPAYVRDLLVHISCATPAATHPNMALDGARQPSRQSQPRSRFDNEAALFSRINARKAVHCHQ